MTPHRTPHRSPTLRDLALVLTLAAAGATGLAVAAPPGGPGAQAGHGAPGQMMPFGGPGMGRLLDEVQATPEQRAQIQQIAEAARQDLRTQHEAGQALRAQSMALFTRPTVDAAAVEKLRQKMLAQHDAASQRTMQAMLAVSQVLTADQRQQIAARMAERQAERAAERAAERGPEKGPHHGPGHGGRGDRPGG